MSDVVSNFFIKTFILRALLIKSLTSKPTLIVLLVKRPFDTIFAAQKSPRLRQGFAGSITFQVRRSLPSLRAWINEGWVRMSGRPSPGAFVLGRNLGTLRRIDGVLCAFYGAFMVKNPMLASIFGMQVISAQTSFLDKLYDIELAVHKKIQRAKFKSDLAKTCEDIKAVEPRIVKMSTLALIVAAASAVGTTGICALLSHNSFVRDFCAAFGDVITGATGFLGLAGLGWVVVSNLVMDVLKQVYNTD
jgi:hypothetical protein